MYPSLSKLKRCFYHQIVELAERPWARELYLVQLFILLYGSARLGSIVVQVFSPHISLFAQYDYAIYMAIHYREYYDVYMMGLVLLFEFFIFVNASVYYGLPADSYTVQWYFQAVVLGERALLASQYSPGKIDKLRKREAAKLASNLKASWPLVTVLIPGKFRHQSTLLLAKLSLWYSLGTVDCGKFARKHQSELVGHFPVKLRLQLLQRLRLIDRLFFWAQLDILLFTLAIMAILFSQVKGGLPFYGLAPFLFDYTLILYQIIQLVYYAYFSVMAIQASSYMGFSMIKDQKDALKGALQLFRKNPNGFHREVAHFLAVYHPLCQFTLRGNDQLSATVFFAFLLTNVPGNVYAIWRLNRKGTPLEVEAVLGLIMGIQVAATWSVMGPMAAFTSTVKTPAQVLPAVQGRIGPRRLGLKLKIEQMYGTLLSGTIACTVGPLNSVTYGYILEFLYTYTGLLFMAFSEDASLNELVKY